MTKSDICRRLSEALGYEVRKEPFMNTERFRLYRNGELVTHTSGNGWTTEEAAWAQLGNYFESEDASARLLEAMPEPELWLESRKDEKFRLWACWADLDGNPEEDYAHHADRKTAIVLAACRWKQIEVGEMEEG